ncbi:hypothetical protein E2C01_018059 [Portunus trituberculatus]|uniref:Uncharacterized protein n=1 Tax=Portunus trituberculatus TaxID=210409 RepID=A0A5B7DUH7_PORTR|nr:hypothetical protein [Portunus trituberculatus]
MEVVVVVVVLEIQISHLHSPRPQPGTLTPPDLRATREVLVRGEVGEGTWKSLTGCVDCLSPARVMGTLRWARGCLGWRAGVPGRVVEGVRGAWGIVGCLLGAPEWVELAPLDKWMVVCQEGACVCGRVAPA